MQRCPGCGEENPDRFRLCGFCGTALGAAPPPAEVRKTVTVVFCDLKGSTSMGERLDSESLREVIGRYFEEMRRVVERHGGTVEKFIGDAVMAVFGLPRLHEDDALRAVRAASDMQVALAKLNGHLQRDFGVTLSNRTGVNTGEVVAGDPVSGQRLVTGDAVNVAARLEQAAPEREVLIGETTLALVRDAVSVEALEPLTLKGKAEPVAAYRLVSVQSGAILPRRPDLPLVGREPELALLDRTLAEATRERSVRLVTVLAHAGVGKTRLLEEFSRAVAGRASTLRGQCLAYGDGITFWPLAEVVRSVAGISETNAPEQARARIGSLLTTESADVANRLSSVIGLSDDVFPIEETFWAARKLLESLAAERALVVVFEDVHWAEPTFLDLVHHLVEAGTDGAVLIVCTARPDLLEEHPAWGEWPGAARVTLEPLSPVDAALMAENLVGGALDAPTRDRIATAAEGNPLYVEQMMSMLIDAGSLRNEGGRWVSGSNETPIAVPPTIHALLSARLDRLGRDERSVLEPASVVGRVFFRGAVEHLSSLASAEAVDAQLGALIRKQFVAPEESTFAGQDSFRFHHALIRDAAYQALLKRARAELHERFVDWMVGVTGPRSLEWEEIMAYHLEQAFRYRLELGPLDRHASELGRRAAALLASAGGRAFARGDVHAAGNLLRRATDALPKTDPERLRLLPDLAEVLIEEGQFAAAEGLLSEAVLGAARIGDRRLHAIASLVRLVARYSTDPDGLGDEVMMEAARAVPTFEQLEDHEGLARAWRLIAQVHGTSARYAEAERAVQQTIEHARLAGNHLLVVRNYPPYAITALTGPTPVPEAMARCEEIVREAEDDRRTEGLVLCALAHLKAMLGRFDDARADIARAKSILEDLGVAVLAAATSLDSGPIEMLAGDPAAAERDLRRDRAVLEAMSERYLLSTMTGFLAQAVFAQDRIDEADELAGRCSDLAADDDVESQTIWRGVRARVLARRDRTDGAQTMALEAVRFARRSDAPVLLGNALMDLSEVLTRAGKRDQAEAAMREAVDLYDAKGNLVSAARARRLLAQDPVHS
jgi:class 3 adenylate cyclase/tetratricopeptide (TPR) repeat protein